jgi:hypothetical protein
VISLPHVYGTREQYCRFDRQRGLLRMRRSRARSLLTMVEERNPCTASRPSVIACRACSTTWSSIPSASVGRSRITYFIAENFNNTRGVGVPDAKVKTSKSRMSPHSSRQSRALLAEPTQTNITESKLILDDGHAQTLTLQSTNGFGGVQNDIRYSVGVAFGLGQR